MLIKIPFFDIIGTEIVN